MILRALEPADLTSLAELCARSEIAAEVEAPPTERALQSAPGTHAALGAFEGERLAGAAGMTALDRPRLRHVGRAWVAADPLAAGPLLVALRDVAARWWRLDRLALSLPAETRMGPALAAAGFQAEVRRRRGLMGAHGPEDGVDHAWVRDGLSFTPSPPELARGPRRPLPASLELRSAVPEDAAAVARVYADRSAIWGTLQVPFTPAEVWRARMTMGEPGRNRLFLAVVEGEVVGTCGLHRDPSPRRPHVWSMGMGMVAGWQGRGLGGVMMRHLLAAAAELGVGRLELEVYDDNTRAIALYERHGFVREGVRRLAVWRDGGHVDVLVMARLPPLRGGAHPPA
jgi:putative acetyltransferase